MTHSGTLTVNGGSFTLDVNGKQLTEENGTTLLQLNGGSLILKDSVGTGSMVGGKRVGNTFAHMIVANGGTLTIQNGNYWVDGSRKEADRGAVIYTAEGANPVVKIKEGSFGRKLQCSKYGFYMLSGTLEVEGGTFSQYMELCNQECQGDNQRGRVPRQSLSESGQRKAEGRYLRQYLCGG